MLTHDLLMLAGIALAALSVILAIVSLSRSRAPVNAARALVAGIVAMVGAAFLNPAPFSIGDIPAALSRIFTQSGLDKLTEVPGAEAVGDAVDTTKKAVTGAADAVAEAAGEVAETAADGADEAVAGVTGAAGAADDAVGRAAPPAVQPSGAAPAIVPPPAVMQAPAEGPLLPAPPVSN